MTGSVRLLGVRVDRRSMAEAVDAIRIRLRGGLPGYVVTLNAAMLGRAANDAEFRRLVDGAALVTPDGIGTLLVGRILGIAFSERVTGVDLAERLCGVCAGEGFRLFLLGGAPGVAEEAARRLAERHPGLHVAGTQHGFYSGDDAAVADMVRTAGAHLLLAALGSPRQEIWLARWLQRSGAQVGVGVGGSLDVFAGRTRRAPRWMGRWALEWIYRVVREPRRWRTAVTLPGVLWMAVRERLRRRGKSLSVDGY